MPVLCVTVTCVKRPVPHWGEGDARRTRHSVDASIRTVLLREDDRGVLAIGQPSHAWISGQLARAWGNERFGHVEPFEEVCLAAEQHDVGWATRDLEPLYNADTGLPRSFMQMPLAIHLGLFTEGPRSLLSQSRYAALLASMHGCRLYERRDLDKLEQPKADAIRAFLGAQREFQSQLVAELRADPAAASRATDGLIERNSLLIWTWDYLSLALCLGWSSATAKRAPSATGELDLELSATDRAGHVRLTPWPFEAPTITVHCEGRRLAHRYDGEEEMRAALAAGPWETLELSLEAG
jgi:hypothetical protein